jgi:predicted nucleic acid-binding protein
VLYLDSSALIKHYQKEEGSQSLEQKLQAEREKSRTIFTSVLSYAEIHAIIARREREKLLSATEANELHDRFDVDWTFELTPVELAVGVLGFVRTIVKTHPLRGTDAAQLASALWLRDAARLGAGPGKYEERVEFSSSDRQLCIAAQKFSLQIFNPLDAS